MTTDTERTMDDLTLFQRRMELLNGGRLRETDRVKSAVKIQDAIRAKSGKFHGSREIRKWREAR